MPILDAGDRHRDLRPQRKLDPREFPDQPDDTRQNDDGKPDRRDGDCPFLHAEFPAPRGGKTKGSPRRPTDAAASVVSSRRLRRFAIEQAAEGDLLLDNDANDLFVEFNFAGLLRGDLKTRYAAYLMGRQGEWLSANDILRFENMPLRTDPGGDDYKNPLTKDSGAAAGDAGAGDQQGNGNNDASTEDSNDG
ncbi:hypothetical protein JOE51_006333 [Bradyrhizobium japonicum]|nr:hypothetical protein [Bradyrhizobium japonicum]